MGVESTATYIDSLVEANPSAGDLVADGYRHSQLIKGALKRTFPNVAGPVSATHGALSYIKTLSSNAQDQIDALSATLSGRINDFSTQRDVTLTVASRTISQTAVETFKTRLSGLKGGDLILSQLVLIIDSGISATDSYVTVELTASSSSGATFDSAGVDRPVNTYILHPTSTTENRFSPTFTTFVATGSGSAVLSIKYSATGNQNTGDVQGNSGLSSVFLKGAK